MLERMTSTKRRMMWMGMKRNSIPARIPVPLAIVVLLLASLLLYRGGTDAFPTMGKDCSSCHTGGSSGMVMTQDAAGAAKTAFSVAPSGKVTLVMVATDLPDSGAFAALVMGSSYGIVEAFDGATNSPDPGTLYVVNNEMNDLDSGAGTIKASINLTIKSTAAEGTYPCEAMLGYKGPEGVKQSSSVTITVVAAPTDRPPAIGAVDFPDSVPLNTPIRVVANISDDNGVTAVVLSYKGPGSAQYTSVDLSLNSGDRKNGSWEEEIPGQTVPGTLYFNINATDGKFFATSPNGSAGKDHAVQVLAPGNPQIAHQPVGTAYIGSDILIEATVTDAGTGVRLFYKDVGAATFSSVAMNRTAGNGSGTSTYSSVIPAQAGKGFVSYYINATNGTLFNSTNVFSVQVAEALDLVLLGVSFSERSPAVHEELIIKAKIWNNSTRELTGVQVSFLDDYYPVGDARYIGLVSNLTIARNATIDVRVWWLPQVNGTHRIRAKADSTNAVKETNESNNEMVNEIAVRAAPAQGSPFLPSTEEFLSIWPLYAVALGVAIGAAAHASRRRSRVQ